MDHRGQYLNHHLFTSSNPTKQKERKPLPFPHWRYLAFRVVCSLFSVLRSQALELPTAFDKDKMHKLLYTMCWTARVGRSLPEYLIASWHPIGLESFVSDPREWRCIALVPCIFPLSVTFHHGPQPLDVCLNRLVFRAGEFALCSKKRPPRCSLENNQPKHRRSELTTAKQVRAVGHRLRDVTMASRKLSERGWALAEFQAPKSVWKNGCSLRRFAKLLSLQVGLPEICLICVGSLHELIVLSALWVGI